VVCCPDRKYIVSLLLGLRLTQVRSDKDSMWQAYQLLVVMRKLHWIW